MKKIALLALLLFSTLSQADSSKIRFNDGWIKQLPPVIPMRAGYLQISNPTDQAHTITALHSDAFEKIEMHETDDVRRHDEDDRAGQHHHPAKGPGRIETRRQAPDADRADAGSANR